MYYNQGDRCPVCSKGKLEATLDPLEFSYKGHTTVFEGFVSFKCGVCSESLLNKMESEVTEVILKALRDIWDKKPDDERDKYTWTVTKMKEDDAKNN